MVVEPRLPCLLHLPAPRGYIFVPNQIAQGAQLFLGIVRELRGLVRARPKRRQLPRIELRHLGLGIVVVFPGIRAVFSGKRAGSAVHRRCRHVLAPFGRSFQLLALSF